MVAKKKADDKEESSRYPSCLQNCVPYLLSPADPSNLGIFRIVFGKFCGGVDEAKGVEGHA
jgi:hypothetical protein